MGNKGGARAAKYDYLIKLLLIGDSGNPFFNFSILIFFFINFLKPFIKKII